VITSKLCRVHITRRLTFSLRHATPWDVNFRSGKFMEKYLCRVILETLRRIRRNELVDVFNKMANLCLSVHRIAEIGRAGYLREELPRLRDTNQHLDILPHMF